MSQSTTPGHSRHFSPHAALAALGVQLRTLGVFAPVEELVRIEQKVIKDRPVQKLYDAFIAVDRLYAGTVPLAAAFQPLVLAAEQTLELTADRRVRTILRMDAGGGSLDDVNWALGRGYLVHCKDYSGARAEHLAASVREWVDDPRVPGRQVGWVPGPAPEYVRPVRRIAVRCPKKDGQWAVGVLVSALAAADVLTLTGQPADRAEDPLAVLVAYVYFYDQRSGGVETSFREDKQGLGLTRRNKQRFAAQQLVGYLGTLACNVLIWARAWLAPHLPRLARYGLLRLVRDVWQISGFVVQDAATGQLVRIVLNHAAPLAAALAAALQQLLLPAQIAVSSGET